MDAITKVFEEMRKRVHCELRVITPEWARQSLEKNDTASCPNRKIDKNRLAGMKKDLSAGRWINDNWDCIAFDQNGDLMNGQHRLSMVAESNTPIVAIVAYGLRDVSKEVNDTGKTRSFSDVLKMRGIPNYSCAARITRALASYDSGQLFWQSGGDAYVQTNGYLTRVFESNQIIIPCAFWYSAQSQNIKVLGFGGVIASVRCIVMRKHNSSTEAVEFFERVATGVDCAVGSSALALRRRLQSFLLDDKSRLLTPQAYALVIHAWNLHHRGLAVNTLRIPKNNPEVM